MADVNKAIETQLANIEKRTGKTLDELRAIVLGSGLTRHGEIREMLKRTLGMGHGDANTLVHHVLQSDGASAAANAGLTTEDVVAALYTGPEAALRPIHDAIMAAVEGFGPFGTAPKKSYVSLRRKKQFAMVGPATQTRVDVGLALAGIPPTDRLRQMPPGSMCSHQVRLTRADEVDEELVAWLRDAYERAG